MILEAQKTEIGYQSFQDSKEYYIDEDFIEENPDCWNIINFISDLGIYSLKVGVNLMFSCFVLKMYINSISN